jgi:hypothetical protein
LMYSFLYDFTLWANECHTLMTMALPVRQSSPF